MTPWLSQPEVDELCEPLVQPAAQIRYLRELGLAVKAKPNGRALVMRSNVEAVLGGLPSKGKRGAPAAAERLPVQPNAAGLRLVLHRG